MQWQKAQEQLYGECVFETFDSFIVSQLLLPVCCVLDRNTLTFPAFFCLSAFLK